MSEKYYELLKALPSLEAGAILKQDGDKYRPVSDIWNSESAEGKTPSICGTYVEHASNVEWFKRVYAVNLLTKTVYKVKAEALAIMNKEFKG
jgi:hypothetical protein